MANIAKTKTRGMETYFSRVPSLRSITPPTTSIIPTKERENSKRIRLELDPKNPPVDPRLRRPIIDYHHNDRAKVRMIYLGMGPIQPRNHDFPQIMEGKENRRFNQNWFDDYPTWLEYSIAKDAAYCLCCYLFKSDSKEHVGSCDAFVVKGFSNWKKVERFEKHIGGHNSAHNQALSKCEALRNQEQHIEALRGQGYDGASNMQGEFNGLKALILKENEYAYYVHCFAHQLQLALVGVAKKNMNISDLFFLVTNVVNVVGGSCKRHDILQEIQLAKIKEALENGELSNGQGLNQETTLKRAGDTRWSSHYRTLVSLEYMFCSILDVLDLIVKDMKLSSDQKAITNELSQALQMKDQDIVNAMTLVRISKQRLQLMRDNVEVPNMVDTYVVPGRVQRHVDKRTVLHHFQVELFFQVIGLQLQELNSHFNEANTELLLCVAYLNPSDSFYAFDKEKLIRLSKFYLKEFPEVQYSTKELDNQRETYILDMRSNTHFVNLKGIGDLAEKMVEKGKHALYPLVYKLITLVLILPVATATVERAFSAMKILKNRLRNRMSYQFMADCLIPYVEKDIFGNIDDETIMCRF
ncbi:uncharacterized protein LOC143853280 [Tasmannia lanceolata]|uniref:uncharacterized protein LOC143853280 n=1 Tax=Tasmannia lanceolata TaxID=3420 RepID=UPI004062CC6C